VVDYLAQWIQSAEHELAKEDCELECVELFLPGHLIEAVMDKADSWSVLDALGHSVPFKYQNYVIRSLERSLHEPIRVRLKKNWERFESCKANNACTYFHARMQCPQKGELGRLKAPGLNLLDLASDVAERQDILYDVVNAGIPIAFWFGHNNHQTPEQRQTCLTNALANVDVTHFVSLAEVWKDLRSEANVRLLVDHPERLHSLSEAENAPMISETQSL
jgi:hypothetical protein